MELHGGSVSVHSDGEGFGSTFTMDIPISDTPISIHIPESHHSFRSILTRETAVFPSNDCLMNLGNERNDNSVRETIRRPGLVYPSTASSDIDRPPPEDISITSSLNVLVVDDVSLSRRMLIRLLSSRFKNISQAKDGSEAVEYVTSTNQKPDVILMDYIMPNMDGPTATKELRALGYKGMIIGVTGNAHPADVEMFISAGATSVLTKPFRLEELFSIILDMQV